MKKLFCLLLALTLGAMGAAAMAEGLDMSQTYCNPLNLPVMDVSTMLSEMPGSWTAFSTPQASMRRSPRTR